MKNIFGIGSLALLSLLSLSSCKKDVRSLDLGLTPVHNLMAPADQATIKLDPVTGPSILFQWSPAFAKDSDLVLYEVAFDKMDGDFSHPVYKAVSDGSGTMTQATVSQKIMNKIASLAGIQASSTGGVKWAVFASKAYQSQKSTEVRSIQIGRPAGFAVVPDSLFITGTATEGGADVSNAIPLKKLSDGVFELYTSLKAGSYLLIDHRNASGTTYFVDVTNNNMIKQGNTATTVSGPTRAYRLGYDFNVATSQAVEIQSMGLYMSAYGQEVGQLAYNGNSTWTGQNIPIQFYPFSWGRDERYKFILHTPGGLEYWGSSNANNVSPAGQPESYFYLFPVTNAQWDNTYKFDPAADNHNVLVNVYFKASGPYTHQVTVQ